MSKPRVYTRELSFSISEDDVAAELGIPAEDEDDEAGAPPPEETEKKKRKRTRPAPDPEEKIATADDWRLKPTTRLLRGPFREGMLKPVLHLFCKLHVVGRENMRGLRGPIIVASNHTSHFDTPVIFEVIPRAVRGRMATAAAADHWFKNWIKGILPGIAFAAFPFPRKGSVGLNRCINLIQQGWSILIFPEGTRSGSGQMGSFKVGVGRMATATGVKILPMHLRGLHRILPKDRSMPRRGDVWIAVGAPIVPQEHESAESVTRRLEDSVRHLGTLLDPYDDGISDEPAAGSSGFY